MGVIRDELERIFAKLKQEREEFRVRAHLASMDAEDAYHELEKKYEHARGRMKGLRDEAEDVSEEVGSAMRLLFDELKDGYRSLRERL